LATNCHQSIGILRLSQCEGQYQNRKRQAANCVSGSSIPQQLLPLGEVGQGTKPGDKNCRSNDETLLVALAHVHWTDGTLFDLESIGQKCRQKEALLIIDGTQSVGALPFDVEKIQPDALICAAYKWLFGPYSLALAYYGPYFDSGMPIEDSWMNRVQSDDFKNLVNYQEDYRSKAARYTIGEQSNFIAIPMMKAAIDQLLEWGVENIQDYTTRLVKTSIEELQAMGCQIESPDYRAAHLFGIQTPDGFDGEALQERLKAHHVFVSRRGDAIRIGPSIYNDTIDFDRLLNCFRI